MTDRPVPNHAVQPPHDVLRHRPLLHEPNERFLNNVVRPIAPLLRIKHEPSPVLIEQP
jgi:hypothetical protein